MPIIRPIEGLHDAEQISKLCWQKNDPAFLTKDGCAYLVVMSMETYEQQMKVLDIYSKLMVAEKQNDEGAPLTGQNMSKTAESV